MTTRSRSILVTGASSGIGRHLAERFAGSGHRVFATARKEADLAGLAAIENVHPLRVDVRDDALVAAAIESIASLGVTIDALVNNAGVGDLGLLPTTSTADVEAIFDVNVLGVHRMTNACLPMLLASRGRIVSVGSQGGTITKSFYGPYSMTKHALEAYAWALDDELRPHGVRSLIVQPGGIVSEIGRNAHARIVARLERAEPPFREVSRSLLEQLVQPAPPDADAAESETNRIPSPPAIVGDAVEDAIFSAAPRRRYLVGTRWEGERVVGALIDRLMDASSSPSLDLSREDLVARLDAAIADRA